jgi:hypothetical protein
VTSGFETLVEEEKKIEDSEQEALELDKLEVSAKKAKAESPPVTTESPKKTEASPKTGPSLWKSLAGMVMSKAFLLSTVVGLVVGAVILFALSSGPPPSEQGVSITDATSRIVYVISSPIGLGHHVDMKLSVPFKDTDEKRDLIKSLAKLKRELPGATRLPKVTQAINKRDLNALRQQVVKIVCSVTGLPSEKVELDIQSLE